MASMRHLPYEELCETAVCRWVTRRVTLRPPWASACIMSVVRPQQQYVAPMVVHSAPCPNGRDHYFCPHPSPTFAKENMYAGPSEPNKTKDSRMFFMIQDVDRTLFNACFKSAELFLTVKIHLFTDRRASQNYLGRIG